MRWVKGFALVLAIYGICHTLVILFPTRLNAAIVRMVWNNSKTQDIHKITQVSMDFELDKIIIEKNSGPFL